MIAADFFVAPVSAMRRPGRAKARRRAGIYSVRNRKNGRVFVGAGMDVDLELQRQKFVLRAGEHENERLQRDFNKYGENRFSFRILDVLPPNRDPDLDDRHDLVELEELWRETLRAPSRGGYIFRDAPVSE